VCSTFQRVKATRSSFSTRVSAGAFEMKYFTSPVATLRATIN
jgi:hypothetical protein